MNNYFIDADWQFIGKIILIVIAIGAKIFFRKDPEFDQKALIVGAVIFILSFSLNTVSFIQLSDFFSQVALIIFVIILIRLFWKETRKPD